MTCQEVQAELSLYLYGELDFAREEACETHLDECPFCQSVLSEEKSWHAALKAQQKDATPEFLAELRQEFRVHLQRERGEKKIQFGFLRRLGELLDVRTTAWSGQLALASLLMAIGFGAARLADSGFFSSGSVGNAAEINFSASPVMRIQNVRPLAGNQVRIVVEQVRDGEISGNAGDERVRGLLLDAARNSVDPGTRVDSVEMLAGQNGEDVRDALIGSVENDPNAAVRLKALEGLRQFTADPVTRDALKFVLSHDRDPGVRSEAIDVLVPADRSLTMTPQLFETLQEVVRSGQEDDYVRARCVQVMQGLKAQGDAY